MINLLPSGYKEEIIFARRNTRLLQVIMSMIIVVIGSMVLLGAGHIYIASATTRYQKQSEQTKAALKEQKLEETKTRIKDLSNNLNLILQVLSREVLFSKLLRQAGAVMPKGSVLSTIEISQVKGGIDLVANAQNYETATQVQLNLQDPNNKLFDKVDIVSVNCGGGTSSKSQYPCTVSLRALFSGDNPYLFINASGKVKK